MQTEAEVLSELEAIPNAVDQIRKIYDPLGHVPNAKVHEVQELFRIQEAGASAIPCRPWFRYNLATAMVIRLQFGCWAVGALLNLTAMAPVYAQITGLEAPCEIADNPSIARLDSAIKEPRIIARLPGILCVTEITKIEQKYTDGTRFGETVAVELRQGRKTLQQGKWSTMFPYYANVHNFSRFAEVPVVDLLTNLLRVGAFTQEDFAELAKSKIAEMRIAAGDNLLDPTLLAQLASAVDENGYLGAYERADVRRSAARRLAQSPGWILEITDQATLAAVAVAYETDAGIRQAALSQLTDQAALTKVIIAHSDCSDCKAAIDKLTSQILLAKVATESRDPRVRILAVAKLTNQAVLARVAAKDPSEKVRQAAHARILR